MAGTGIKGGPKHTPDPVKDPENFQSNKPSGNGKPQGPKYSPDMPQDSGSNAGGNPFQEGEEVLNGVITHSSGTPMEELMQNVNSMEFQEQMVI